MQISVLASSSKGNATVLSSGGTHLMIDTGISATRIRNGLKECGLTQHNIHGYLFTHEHTDHICGLGVLAKSSSLPIFCTRYMGHELRAVAPNATYTYIEPGAPIQIGAFTVTAFAVSHDATDPVGYLIESNGVRLGYVTDTGRIMRGMDAILTGVDALYLESNYDPGMLSNSGRPRYLIDRIAGNWGHLSNEQASDFVRTLAHRGLRHLILGHLSQDCNTPECARANMQKTLDNLQLPTRLHVAPAAYALPTIDLSESIF